MNCLVKITAVFCSLLMANARVMEGSLNGVVLNGRGGLGRLIRHLEGRDNVSYYPNGDPYWMYRPNWSQAQYQAYQYQRQQYQYQPYQYQPYQYQTYQQPSYQYPQYPQQYQRAYQPQYYQTYPTYRTAYPSNSYGYFPRRV